MEDDSECSFYVIIISYLCYILCCIDCSCCYIMVLNYALFVSFWFNSLGINHFNDNDTLYLLLIVARRNKTLIWRNKQTI